MLRSKRLRNEDGVNVPGTPTKAGMMMASAMTPTPLKRAKRGPAYEMGENKEMIEIFLRVRPTAEGQRNMLIDSTSSSVVMPTKDRADQTRFTYSEVFTEETSQDLLFKRVAQPLLDDFIDAERSCFLFAYGNSNAGKTYTIYGNEGAPGILPRVLGQIFDRVSGPLKAKQAFLMVSFVEVYGEAFYNLLKPREKLRLKEASSGIYFGDADAIVDSLEGVLKLVELGQRNRQVADTHLNQDSSRSHSLFTVNLVKINPNFTKQMVRDRVPGSTKVVQFCIADLAGSERAKRTQNTGARLKEAGHINGALMTFRKCVEAALAIQRGAANTVIPYRESKLTHAVRDFFIGQAKGRMIINVSTAEDDLEETLHVLDFANIAKEVSTSLRRADRRVPGCNPTTTPYAARPSITAAAAAAKENDAKLEGLRASIEDLTRRLAEAQQKVYDLHVEMINKEMEVRQECAAVMAKRLQEMEVMSQESVERAIAFSEDKYIKKIEILSQFIRFQDASQPQQAPAKGSLEELAAHMDAEHWKRKYEEAQQTLEAKDRTIKSLQIQLQDIDETHKENKKNPKVKKGGSRTKRMRTAAE